MQIRHLVQEQFKLELASNRFSTAKLNLMPGRFVINLDMENTLNICQLLSGSPVDGCDSDVNQSRLFGCLFDIRVAVNALLTVDKIIPFAPNVLQGDLSDQLPFPLELDKICSAASSVL